jgi:hypothetical protein
VLSAATVLTLLILAVATGSVLVYFVRCELAWRKYEAELQVNLRGAIQQIQEHGAELAELKRLRLQDADDVRSRG